MTKNQIIAKAMLSGLGIYAIVAFSTALVHSLNQANNIWAVSTNIFLVVAALLLIGRFMIFKNDGLACKIAGQARDAEQFDRRVYLIKTFRIALVILALSLLSYYRTFSTVMDFLQAFSLPQIRLWMRNLIHGGHIQLSWKYSTVVLELFKLAIIAYLLCGGFKLISWHLKNSNLNNSNEEPENE